MNLIPFLFFASNRRKLAEDVYASMVADGAGFCIFNNLKDCKLINVSRCEPDYLETDREYMSRMLPKVFPFVCAATIAELDTVDIMSAWTRVCGDENKVFWQVLVSKIENVGADIKFRQLISEASDFIRDNYLAASPQGANWPKPFDWYNANPDWSRECASEWLRMRLEDGDCGKRYIYNAERGFHGEKSLYAACIECLNERIRFLLGA